MITRTLLVCLATVAVSVGADIEISFEREILSILTTKGCNSSACHGSSAGQNGSKLSLQGTEPANDHAMIVTGAKGRRVDLANPENSLLLKKPAFALPHGGGHILTKNSDEYRALLHNGCSMAPNGSIAASIFSRSPWNLANRFCAPPAPRCNCE